MNTLYNKLILAILAFQFAAIEPSWAVLDLIVREKINVYKKRSTKSKVVTKLQRGDKVVISPRTYGAWRKVLVTYEGKRQGAYVLKKDINLSMIKERSQSVANDFMKSRSLGGHIGLSYQIKDSEDLDIVSFPDANIGAQSGFSNYFGFKYHMPYPDRSDMLLQFSIQNREIFLQGNAELVNGIQDNTVEITEKSISVASFLKIYKDSSSYFWKGFGAELAKVTNVEMELENGSSFGYSGDLPLYIMATGGLGWDIKVQKDFYVLPEIKLNLILNEQPFLISIDSFLSIAWTF